MSSLISTILLIGALASSSSSLPTKPARNSFIAAEFGGECTGTDFRPSAELKRLIDKSSERNSLAAHMPFGYNAFAYDLNGDGRNEYFVRLSCGGTGNCEWGIFSPRPARLRGIFTAWFFYIHRRKASWSALTTYTREGGDQGINAALVNRNGSYFQTYERTEHGYPGNWQPFLKRMGIPKCS